MTGKMEATMMMGIEGFYVHWDLGGEMFWGLTWGAEGKGGEGLLISKSLYGQVLAILRLVILIRIICGVIFQFRFSVYCFWSTWRHLS